MDAGFLAEFAYRRFLGLLAVVDPALRHLPRLARGIEPLADEDAAVAVGEHDTRAGAVGEFAMVDHGAPLASATIAFNTVNAPRISSRRSEERRGGKECCSTCRSRWSTCH